MCEPKCAKNKHLDAKNNNPFPPKFLKSVKGDCYITS